MLNATLHVTHVNTDSWDISSNGFLSLWFITSFLGFLIFRNRVKLFQVILFLTFMSIYTLYLYYI